MNDDVRKIDGLKLRKLNNLIDSSVIDVNKKYEISVSFTDEQRNLILLLLNDVSTVSQLILKQNQELKKEINQLKQEIQKPIIN